MFVSNVAKIDPSISKVTRKDFENVLLLLQYNADQYEKFSREGKSSDTSCIWLSFLQNQVAKKLVHTKYVFD